MHTQAPLHRPALAALATTLTMLAACAQAPADEAAPAQAAAAALSVARSLGLAQCAGDDAAARAQRLVKGLRGAGVEADALRCAHDGRMRPQVCGAPDGRLVVVDIPAGQADAARAQGFEPLLARWPEARSQPCR